MLDIFGFSQIEYKLFNRYKHFTTNTSLIIRSLSFTKIDVLPFRCIYVFL